ncbi:MAG: hypothetical protein A3H31_03270 [Gallionellales bacterium RIFCSPLOWO2_02_FULL_57_47]|nr:MAG: hypothetical protein A3H31_03270 [Gallionellales bacterium RIFCSPLOWO2_02_FULL_57_47]
MRLDLYQAESERIANEQMALLAEAKQRLVDNAPLSRLEQSGVLHAFQVLIENAIGKSKHLLKQAGKPVPVSAYDTFASLEQNGDISSQELQQWNAAIGLRNRIVHDYMNIEMEVVYELITNDRYQFIGAFLCKPIPAATSRDAKI